MQCLRTLFWSSMSLISIGCKGTHQSLESFPVRCNCSLARKSANTFSVNSSEGIAERDCFEGSLAHKVSNCPIVLCVQSNYVEGLKSTKNFTSSEQGVWILMWTHLIHDEHHVFKMKLTPVNVLDRQVVQVVVQSAGGVIFIPRVKIITILGVWPSSLRYNMTATLHLTSLFSASFPSSAPRTNVAKATR